MIHNSSQKGFSLLELIVYMAVFIVMVLMISNIIIAVFSGRDTSNSRIEVSQNLRFAAERIKQMVYDSSSFSVLGSCPLNTLEVTVSGSTTSISIAAGRLEEITSSTVARITSDIVTATTSASCLFAKISNPSPAKPTLTVNLKINYNDGGNPQLQFSDEIRTTVSGR